MHLTLVSPLVGKQWLTFWTIDLLSFRFFSAARITRSRTRLQPRSAKISFVSYLPTT